MTIRAGSRVAWSYQGATTYGKVIGIAGTRATITTPNGQVTRVGNADDPVVRLRSESTGRMVLKRRSELREAPKK